MIEKWCRKGAGQNPEKRAQIIEGARRVFMDVGFDAASMNDITREAGVSKGTIYVYFESKEDLFMALMHSEHLNMVKTSSDLLQGDRPVADILYHYGISITQILTSADHILKMRMVIGASNRLPSVAKSIFAEESENMWTVLQGYFDQQCQMQQLWIEDTVLAAVQFIDMMTARLIKRGMLCVKSEEPDMALIEYNVASAVRVFMRAYGQPQTSDPLAGIERVSVAEKS